MSKPSFKLFTILLALAFSTGCNFGAQEAATATAEMSSDDVLRTAEAIAEATRNAATATHTRQPTTPTATFVQETPTPEASATPSSPILAADYNANVRSGPDEVFGAIDFLLQGDQAEVVGRYINEENGTWWYIQRIGDGRDGWIWGGAVTFFGNENVIPVLESPPTPTPGPSPTPTEAS
jgi:hypothetical protein